MSKGKGTVTWTFDEKREYSLPALRKSLGVTQVELAKRVGMSQGEISRLERRGNHKVSNLRRYLKGLGCTVHFTARFPTGASVDLTG